MRSEILKKISNQKKTNKINLANMKIENNEVSHIMEAIKLSIPKINILNLDNNALSDDGARVLTTYLIEFHYLTELSLQHNNIGKKGAASIFSLKKQYPKLTILFHGNHIYDVGEMAEIERMSLSAPNEAHFMYKKRQ